MNPRNIINSCLGPLECDGDTLFSDVVTFRKDDAVIELPSVEFGQSGDIYFEFKTTSMKTMVLVHSEGSKGDFIKVSTQMICWPTVIETQTVKFFMGIK